MNSFIQERKEIKDYVDAVANQTPERKITYAEFHEIKKYKDHKEEQEKTSINSDKVYSGNV